MERKTLQVHEVGILLRFRDLVTEPGGTIPEHQRLIKHRGYAWWGWWARQKELTPRDLMGRLNPTPASPIQIVLFDRGADLLYSTYSDKIIMSPTPRGIMTPEIEFTPEYYIRGRYPAWFRLSEEIKPLAVKDICIVSRPTIVSSDQVEGLVEEGVSIDLETLGNEPATLWVIKKVE